MSKGSNFWIIVQQSMAKGFNLQHQINGGSWNNSCAMRNLTLGLLIVEHENSKENKIGAS